MRGFIRNHGANIVIALLTMGAVAGYSSGIYSMATRDDDDRRGCTSRHRAWHEARE